MWQHVLARRPSLAESVVEAPDVVLRKRKILKMGAAFGGRVLFANNAVQGCFSSIPIVDSLYIVFSKHLEGFDSV